MADSKTWLDYFIHNKMMWIHDGDSTKPHVVLRSGLHSGGYFNSTLVTQCPRILEDVVRHIQEMLHNAGTDFNNIDWVVGPLCSIFQKFLKPNRDVVAFDTTLTSRSPTV